MVKVKNFIRTTNSRLIGPNCPGIISPGKCKVGIMPSRIHRQGNVGIVSRSGTLTYLAVNQITNQGMGQSTGIGIGGDPLIGTTFVDVLEMFKNDKQTEAVVMIGEIGGSLEEQAAEYIGKKFPKPVVAFIAGQTAPAGRRMGHAGAIISGGRGTALEKMEILKKNGVCIVENPAEIGIMVKKILG
jgi:succinyl-CoA synthetase alpha subunit